MFRTARGRLWIVFVSLVALVTISAPATAAAKDRNRDRIPDRWERAYGLSLNKDQRKLDQDRDGLRNRGEWLAGLSPRDRDTDDDGTPDLREQAGVISAWDPDALNLEITLFAGGTLTGKVSEYTKVKCPPAADPIDGGELPEPATAHFGGPPPERGPQAGRPAWAGPPEGPRPPWPRPPRPDRGANCSLDDLAVGVEVDQADVRYSAEGAVFTRLKIDVPAPTPEPEPEPQPETMD